MHEERVCKNRKVKYMLLVFGWEQFKHHTNIVGTHICMAAIIRLHVSLNYCLYRFCFVCHCMFHNTFQNMFPV